MAQPNSPAADSMSRDVDSIKRFCSHLSDSGLVNGETIRSVWDSFDETDRPRNAKELAQELIRRKRLTPFQYQRLEKGAGKTLKLGQYTIVDRIGEGGMGEVLKARHDRMQRDVAVKIISEKFVDSAESLERFHQEARAAAQLSHPNIVAAYDAGESDGVHYLVMEYVDGFDLSTIIANKGPLRVALALDYIIQAAEGLQYSHRKGIVHRDIKPANLLVDSTGVVKILDMGLAFVAQHADVPEETTNQRLTQQGQIMGTCAFMAPEQAVDIRKADARSDIYSLGCTLFDLLVGRPPYEGDTHMGVIVAHREDPIPSICVHRNEAPPAIDEVFRKMVAKRPKDRFASMGEVIGALRGCTMDGFSLPSAATPAPARKRAKPPAVSINQESIAELAHSDTINVIPTAHDTSVSIRRTTPAGIPKVALLAGAALLMLMLLGGGALAVVLSLNTPHGKLVVESDDPDVKIAVKQNGEVIEIVDADDAWSVGLKEGQYDLELTGGQDQVRLEQNVVTVRRGETERLRVTFTPAIATNTPKLPQPGDGLPNAGPPNAVLPPIANVPLVRPAGIPRAPAGTTAPVVDALPKLKLVHALTGRRSSPNCVAFSPDGKTFAAGGRDGHFVMWDVASGGLLRQYHLKMEAWNFVFSPDSKTIAVVGGDLGAAIYNAETGAVIHTLSGMSKEDVQAEVKKNNIYPLMMSAAFSPDGKRLLTGDNHNEVLVWDTKTGEQLEKLEVHSDDIMAIKFSADGKHFATASWDGTSQLWNATTNKPTYMLKNGSESTAYDLDFSPDGKILYTVGNATDVIAWSVETGEKILGMHGHGAPVVYMTISSDGKLIASVGSGDHSVRFWDAPKGKTLSVLRGEASLPGHVVFSPTDPTLFATATGDARVKLWRYEGEEENTAGNIRVTEDGMTVVHQEIADDHLSMPPWQSFRPPLDGALSQVDLQPCLSAGTEVTLSIYAGEGVDGERLYTQPCRIPDTGRDPWKAFELDKPLALTADVAYTVELAGAVGMYHAKTDRYGEGRGSGGADMAFRLYFRPEE